MRHNRDQSEFAICGPTADAGQIPLVKLEQFRHSRPFALRAWPPVKETREGEDEKGKAGKRRRRETLLYTRGRLSQK